MENRTTMEMVLYPMFGKRLMGIGKLFIFTNQHWIIKNKNVLQDWCLLHKLIKKVFVDHCCSKDGSYL